MGKGHDTNCDLFFYSDGETLKGEVVEWVSATQRSIPLAVHDGWRVKEGTTNHFYAGVIRGNEHKELLDQFANSQEVKSLFQQHRLSGWNWAKFTMLFWDKFSKLMHKPIEVKAHGEAAGG